MTVVDLEPTPSFDPEPACSCGSDDWILDHVADAVIVCDERGRITRANRAAEELCPEVRFGRSFACAVPLEIAGLDLHDLFAEVRAGREFNRLDAHLPVRGAQPREVAVSVRRLDGRAGRPAGCVVTLADISAHARSEDFLRRSEQRFRTSVEAMLDCFGVYACERDGLGKIRDFVIAYLNAAARRDDSVVARGQSVGERLHGVLEPTLAVHLHRLFCEVVLGQQEYAGDVSVADPREADGARLFELRIAPLDDGCVAVWRDITERKRAALRQAEYERQLAEHRDRLQELVDERTAELARTHERLRVSERMASIGTLSAGLGHDMGNILLPIRARLDAIEACSAAQAFEAELGAIRASVVYLQKLASGLRMLALDPDENDASGSTTDLGQWWGEFDRLLVNCLPRHVELIREFPPELPAIRLARHRLTQLVFNLVQNAGNAMRESRGTRVRLAAEPLCDERGELARVRLCIEDDGPGMTAEVRRRCLEPFFTTRTRRFSTGLGLTLAHGIVTQAGGTMQLESELGVGTRFVIELPAAAEEQRAAASPIVVAITLGDSRMRAYAASLLRTFGARVEYVEPSEQTAVWLAQIDDASELLTFLEADERRWGLLLSDNPAEHPRLIQLPPPLRPAELRAALSRVVRRVQNTE